MALPLLPGDPRQLGRYQLLARLGQGGMGTVFLGEGPDGRPVALKVIRHEYAHDPEFRRRFRSEVSRAQQVPPFSTAEVLDADPDHDPPYLVVEYVNGPSLDTILAESGNLAGAALHTLAIGTATALTAIHGAGVIHRDLKPANVLLPPGGIKVIDFGIARPLDVTGHHTATHQVVGTLAYMAPERFESDNDVGTPADIFAWGVLIAHAAAGRTPFAGETPPATAMRILTRPPDLDGVTGTLRDLVEHALAKDPADRPTARQLLDALVEGGPVAAAVPPPTVPTPSAQHSHRSPGRRRALLPARPIGRIALAAAVLALLAGAGLTANALAEDRAVTPEVPVTAALAPSATPSAPAKEAATRPSRVQGFFAGGRKAVIHLSELDDNIYIYPGGGSAEVTSAIGELDAEDETQFALEPFGVDYQIKWLSQDHPDHCLGVRINPGIDAILVTAPCHQTDATVFEVSATGAKDTDGNPTYAILSRAYGVVHWSEQDQKIIVQEAGDAPTGATTFVFLDRGPL
ncbi:serine/threonine-protein kinase [Actinoplanes sp. NPDC051859]|uniref:serine/threonine-protein kinase n=1 Tax=Actinoplanes sp. NPDC051859 TaxID=3363909 RepID=UPI00378BEE34